MPQKPVTQQAMSSHSGDVISDMKVKFIDVVQSKGHNFLRCMYNTHKGFQPSCNEAGFISHMNKKSDILVHVTPGTAQHFNNNVFTGTEFIIKKASITNWQHNVMSAKEKDIVPSSPSVTILPKQDRHSHKVVNEFNKEHKDVSLKIKLEDNLPEGINSGNKTKYELQNIFERNVRPSYFQDLDKNNHVKLRARFEGKDVDILLKMPEGLPEHKDPITRVLLDIMANKDTNIASLQQIAENEYIASGTEDVPAYY